MSAEEQRLHEDARRAKNWKRWGPYLSERQWGEARALFVSPGAVTVPGELGFVGGLMVRDPDGHALRLVQR